MAPEPAQQARLSCFEGPVERGTDADARRGTAALVHAALSALAAEWWRLAQDITRLGESLSAQALAQGRLEQVRTLQAFDLIGQDAAAQARLLQEFSYWLASPKDFTASRVLQMIGKVPFQEVRRRLSAAIEGPMADPSDPSEDDSSVQWF